jgi:hypothetical protein
MRGGGYTHHPRPRTEIGAAPQGDHNDVTDGQRFREQDRNPAGADVDTRPALSFNANERWIRKTPCAAAFRMRWEWGHGGSSPPIHDKT